VDPALFHPRADFLLRVQGMSMKNIGIMDGDLLAVHKTQEVRNGQVVVARLDEDVTVKRFQRKGSQVWLLPENEELSPKRPPAGGLFIFICRWHLPPHLFASPSCAHSLAARHAFRIYPLIRPLSWSVIREGGVAPGSTPWQGCMIAGSVRRRESRLRLGTRTVSTLPWLVRRWGQRDPSA